MNIGCYHAKTFDDWETLASLPSSRVALSWAQSVLFPEAEAGKRVVICMRSTRWWGLDAGESGELYGEALYAPRITRSGYLRKGPMRDQIVRVVRERLGFGD